MPVRCEKNIIQMNRKMSITIKNIIFAKIYITIYANWFHLKILLYTHRTLHLSLSFSASVLSVYEIY